MKIIKKITSTPVSSEFGDFELKPDEGWKIFYSFIDFESNLLIVTVSQIDESKWINSGFGSRNIPTKEYKIDRKKALVLSREEWMNYFNYEKTETISADGKYKLISQRIYDPERDNDSIKEELVDIESGKLMSSSTSIAFSDKKRETLLDGLYKTIKEKEEKQKVLDSALSLDQYFRVELPKLKDMDDIICYYSSLATFQLSFIDGKFHLFKGPVLPESTKERASMRFFSQSVFDTLDAFWNSFSSEEQWYVKYNFLNVKGKLSYKVLLKYFIKAFNKIRQQQHFNFKEYNHIQKWENVFWCEEIKPTEWKQWCPCCGHEIAFNPRYPKYICGSCYSKDKRDQKGTHLEFYNQGVGGGFKVVYLDENKNILREDDTQSSCDCFIDGQPYFAQEARFGGIVIQKRDEIRDKE